MFHSTRLRGIEMCSGQEFQRTGNLAKVKSGLISGLQMRDVFMSFSYKETQVVKGMLERGDRQHDISSYFGVNGGRIGEVASGKCDYPNAQPMAEEKLPPLGPYVGAKTVFAIIEQIDETIALLEEAGQNTEGCEIAVDALKRVKLQIQN